MTDKKRAELREKIIEAIEGSGALGIDSGFQTEMVTLKTGVVETDLHKYAKVCIHDVCLSMSNEIQDGILESGLKHHRRYVTDGFSEKILGMGEWDDANLFGAILGGAEEIIDEIFTANALVARISEEAVRDIVNDFVSGDNATFPVRVSLDDFIESVIKELGDLDPEPRDIENVVLMTFGMYFRIMLVPAVEKAYLLAIEKAIGNRIDMPK